MKNCIKIPVLLVFICFLVSCNTDEKIPGDSPSVTKEKKESSAATKKRKEKKLASKTGSTAGKNKTGSRAEEIGHYAAKNGYSTKYCFLVDMSVLSGKNRFFVYDLEKGTVAWSGLVAHGSCNENFLSRPRFSNMSNCGCSSVGRYKIGSLYRGQYGKSYRLHGLDQSNSNAFKRAVVLHGYDCVPDQEIHPMVLCNSLGCPMVSPRFFDKLSRLIERSERPILLWVYR